MGGITRKWRPPLFWVLALTVGAILSLPLAGLLALRGLAPILGTRQAILLIGGVILILSALVGYVLWRVLLRPITALAARAEAAAQGAPGALDPLSHYGTQEMERLGRNVLNMGRILQGREAVLRSYADHVTHELTSPLTVLRGAAELLEDADTPAARRPLIDRINSATDRMMALLQAQRALAHAQDPMPAGQTAVSTLIPALARAHPGLVLHLAVDATQTVPPEALRIVLDHLIANAAAAGAGQVTLTACPGGLRIDDDGSGISDGNRARIFDPFFTTRRDTGGTGMGLPIVRRMLAAHGAMIELESGPGARFVLRF